MKVKEESEKVGLKLNIQKTKIVAPSPITSWEIGGETVETVADFIFLGSKITAIVIAAMKLKDTYSLEGKLYYALHFTIKSLDLIQVERKFIHVLIKDMIIFTF